MIHFIVNGSIFHKFRFLKKQEKKNLYNETVIIANKPQTYNLSLLTEIVFCFFFFEDWSFTLLI